MNQTSKLKSLIYKFEIFIFFLFFSSFFLYPPIVSAQQVNSGFVSGIWYSQTPFFAGETIRIYSAIQNEAGFDIAGKLRFFDGEEIIGESEFSSISGHLIEEWIDWTVTQGEHNIKIEIIDAVKSSPNSNKEPIELLSNTSPIDAKFADIDTDKDRVGNQIDEDDDNDGLTDEREIELGTDPLKQDSDNDGVNDMEEFGTQETKSTNAPPNNEALVEIEKKKIESKIMTTYKNTKNFLDSGIEKITKQVILSLERKMNETEIASQENNTSDSPIKKSFLKNFYSIMLSLLIWFFNNKWVIYGLLLITVVIILKVLRLFRRRR
ncbi:MAG: thrombospondin type 3 repeat-containing protein [bacterium]|nr:thrombospondin type 3 repeat-containing protein [bacterium]